MKNFEGPDVLKLTDAPESVAKFVTSLPVVCNSTVPSRRVRVRKYSLSTGNVTWTVVDPHEASTGWLFSFCQPSPRAQAAPAGIARRTSVHIATSVFLMVDPRLPA